MTFRTVTEPSFPATFHLWSKVPGNDRWCWTDPTHFQQYQLLDLQIWSYFHYLNNLFSNSIGFSAFSFYCVCCLNNLHSSDFIFRSRLQGTCSLSNLSMGFRQNWYCILPESWLFTILFAQNSLQSNHVIQVSFFSSKYMGLEIQVLWLLWNWTGISIHLFWASLLSCSARSQCPRWLNQKGKQGWWEGPGTMGKVDAQLCNHFVAIYWLQVDTLS